MSRAPSGLSSHSSVSELAPPRPFAGPLSIVLFVRTLRLLDLDLLEDWPGITPQTFSTKDSAQNQKARIKATEWALYRLFEIWDPDETQEKLLPFFPPLEPLQSLNLRAALFRSLNDLKKSGVLSRDIVLRRTILDDCKGDKFHDILLGFSSAVLKRELGHRQPRGSHVPPARNLALANPLTPSQQTSLLPLAVAHKADLSALLRRKAEQKARLEAFAAFLDEKQHELARRDEQSRLELQELHASDGPQESKEDVKRALQNHWLGDIAWLDALVSGKSGDPSERELERPWKDVWSKKLHGKKLKAEDGSMGLLEDLQSRVRDQQERLEQWKIIHERTRQLLGLSDSFARKLHARQAAPSSKFDKHLDLNLDGIGKSDNDRPAPAAPIDPKVQAVLTELGENIQKCSTISQRGQQSSDRRATSQRSAHGRENRSHLTRKMSGRSQESNSPGDDPGMARNHGFRPFPIRMESGTSSRSSTKGLRPLSLLAMSPVKLPPHSQGSSPNPAFDRGFSPMRTSSFTSTEGPSPDTRSPASEGASDYVDPRTSSSSANISPNPLSRAPTMPPPSRPYLSLSERTRLSMAPVATLPSEEDDPAPAETVISAEKDSYERRHAELLERTRQSMRRASMAHESAMANPSNAGQTPRHERTASRSKNGRAGKRGSVYSFPVNVWESESPEFEKHTSLPKVLRKSTCAGADGSDLALEAPIKPLPVQRTGQDGSIPLVRTTADEDSERNETLSGSHYPDSASAASLSPRSDALATLNGAKVTPRRDATPTEMLFSPAAEYASVFKSRPKIATSPLLRPMDNDDAYEEAVD